MHAAEDWRCTATENGTPNSLFQGQSAVGPALGVNGALSAPQGFEAHVEHARAYGSENAALRQPASDRPAPSLHKDMAGSLSGMHEDDVGGLGDIDGDAAHLLAQDVRFPHLIIFSTSSCKPEVVPFYTAPVLADERKRCAASNGRTGCHGGHDAAAAAGQRT